MNKLLKVNKIKVNGKMEKFIVLLIIAYLVLKKMVKVLESK